MRLLRSLISAVFLLPGCHSYSYGKLQARIVTHPIATTILTRFSEAYGRKSKKYIAPLVVEAVGSHSITNFCSHRTNAADILVAHRRLTPQDLAKCGTEGISDFLELRMGFGAVIALASSGLNIKNISHDELYSAVTKYKYKQGNILQNTTLVWNEVSSNNNTLPSEPIEVFAPAPNTDLRDVFEDRVLVHGCQTNKQISAIRDKKPKLYRDLCLSVRGDAQLKEVNFAAVETSPSQLLKDHHGVIVFAPASALSQADLLNNLISVDGFKPTPENITSDDYPLSAPIYLYVKISTLQSSKGLQNFLKYIYSSQNTDITRLSAAGFIPLSPQEMSQQFQLVAQGSANFHLEGPSFFHKLMPKMEFANTATEPEMPATFQDTPLAKASKPKTVLQPSDNIIPQPLAPSIDHQLQNPADIQTSYFQEEPAFKDYNSTEINQYAAPVQESVPVAPKPKKAKQVLRVEEPDDHTDFDYSVPAELEPEIDHDMELDEEAAEDQSPDWHKLFGS